MAQTGKKGKPDRKPPRLRLPQVAVVRSGPPQDGRWQPDFIAQQGGAVGRQPIRPDAEVSGVCDILRRHQVRAGLAVVVPVVTAHYAYLHHVGLLRPDWLYPFLRQGDPLRAQNGLAIPARWVPLPRDAGGPEWQVVHRLCTEADRWYERWGPQGVGYDYYERLWVGDDGWAAWVMGAAPYGDPEVLRGLYRLADGTDPEAFGRPRQVAAHVGLEEVPWIVERWAWFGKGAAPSPPLVGAVLEAQYRYLCAQGIVDDDPRGWRPPTAEDLARAMLVAGQRDRTDRR
ncbi:MAG: hypothetical protein K6U87_03235 [Firmicutes bacterium]|nr:hypothetical protein [Bacillota bacterium]